MIRFSPLNTAVALGAVMAMASPAFAQTTTPSELQAETPAPQAAPETAPAQAAEPTAPEQTEPLVRPEPEPQVGTPEPGQVGAFKGGAVVALDRTYRAIGQVFRPASADPIGRFAFMLEVYDGSVNVIGELLEWDPETGAGASLWLGSDLVNRSNQRLEPVAFDTGGLVLDPAKQYLMVIRIQDSDSLKGAGIGAAYPGDYEDGYLVRQQSEGYDVLQEVDATFIVLPKTEEAPAAAAEEPAAEPSEEPSGEPAEQPAEPAEQPSAD